MLDFSEHYLKIYLVNDIFVQSDTIDNYYNVTLKEVLTYKYILSLPWTARPDFIVKVDDDSYVNIPELWRVFMSSKTFPTHDLLVGYRWVDAPVQREGSTGDPRSRCPMYMYSGTKYPTYLSGAGHPNRPVGSRETLCGNRILNYELTTPYC